MTKLFIIFAFVSSSIFAQRDNSSLSFLKTEGEAAMQRLNLLEKAKHEILVSYFIYDDDRIGLSGLVLLLDPRSAQVNTEVAVVIKDQSVTKALNEQLQEDMRHSSLVQIRNGKIQGSYDECDKSLKDKFIYYLMRPISRVPWIYNLL